MSTQPDWQFASSNEPERGGRIKRLAGFGIMLAVLALLVVAGAPLARMYLDVPSMSAFRIFLYAVQFGLVLTGLGLLLTVIAVYLRAASAWKRGLVMAVLGLLPLASILVTLGPDRFASPMIHDVTTDTDDPPEFDKARELRSAEENSLDYGGAEIAERQQAAWPELGPVITDKSLELAFQRAIETVMELDWHLVNADFDTGIIEAYDSTRLFGFVDDVVIRVRPHESGSRVDIRSVSRIGLGDAGKNAARIREFIRTY